MTLIEFRKNPVYTSRMREILSDPVMQECLVALKDSAFPVEDIRNPSIMQAPEVASVRMLSQLAGYNKGIHDLLMMAEHIEDRSKALEAAETSTYEPEN